MRRLRQTRDGPSVLKAAQPPPPLGPGMGEAILRDATRLERWDSEWNDAQAQTECRFYRGTTLVETPRIEAF